MKLSAANDGPGLGDVALAYHQRSKHRLDRFAAGPETLDWEAQPEPFRWFEGSPSMALPLVSDRLTRGFDQLDRPADGEILRPGRASVAALLELSFGLSAWKQDGPDRWALRCNPSSGNLHPTEVYVIAEQVAGLEDGVYHYVSRDHRLELRCRRSGHVGGRAGLWVGLTSIHWREAWKYGERALRYCQLDVGHALAGLRYAAATLGWRARLVEGLDSTGLSALLGLDRPGDFAGVEPESPELLVALEHGGGEEVRSPGRPNAQDGWYGVANRIDPRPFYHWPILAEVSRATEGRVQSDTGGACQNLPPQPRRPSARAADILLGRRSAQRFESQHVMGTTDFFDIIDAVMPRAGVPFDIWHYRPRLHGLIYVHRVQDVPPGLYALVRDEQAQSALQSALTAPLDWQRFDLAPPPLPFFRLLSGNLQAIARTASCRQAIAADSCFSLTMLAEFAPLVQEQPFRYRQLFWEAGLLGQILYLEAEARGLRGTGVGCYFDDAVHDWLGLQSAHFQSLYHFCVGRPRTDDRLTSLPAYPGRTRDEWNEDSDAPSGLSGTLTNREHRA